MHYLKVRNGFTGELWTQDERAAKKYQINRISSENKPGLGRFGFIHQGGNSGYQAINLAYLWGASKIVLLGFDCGAGKDGKAHWFGQHPPGLGQRQPFDYWVKLFPKLAEDLAADGVVVVNASRETALTCFERQKLSEVVR